MRVKPQNLYFKNITKNIFCCTKQSNENPPTIKAIQKVTIELITEITRNGYRHFEECLDKEYAAKGTTTKATNIQTFK